MEFLIMKINVNDYKSYYFETALKIFNTPSPTGYYREIEGVLAEYAKDLGVEFQRTNKGCFILTLPGKRKEMRLNPMQNHPTSSCLFDL
jgi:hypothetical protein